MGLLSAAVGGAADAGTHYTKEIISDNMRARAQKRLEDAGVKRRAEQREYDTTKLAEQREYDTGLLDTKNTREDKYRETTRAHQKDLVDRRKVPKSPWKSSEGPIGTDVNGEAIMGDVWYNPETGETKVPDYGGAGGIGTGITKEEAQTVLSEMHDEIEKPFSLDAADYAKYGGKAAFDREALSRLMAGETKEQVMAGLEKPPTKADLERQEALEARKTPEKAIAFMKKQGFSEDEIERKVRSNFPDWQSQSDKKKGVSRHKERAGKRQLLSLSGADQKKKRQRQDKVAERKANAGKVYEQLKSMAPAAKKKAFLEYQKYWTRDQRKTAREMLRGIRNR